MILIHYFFKNKCNLVLAKQIFRNSPKKNQDFKFKMKGSEAGH